MMQTNTNTQCLSVALIGAPNVGKSTLTNLLVGDKVSIVTPKVQTTRNVIRGILTEGKTQIVFVDTPGVFRPKKSLEKHIVRSAWQGMLEADVFLLLIDAKKGLCKNTQDILQALKQKHSDIPVLLGINKIDLVKPARLLPLVKLLNDAYAFEHTFMISAKKEDGIAELKTHLFDKTINTLARHFFAI
jgi:GTP-binding protein Era